MLVTALAVVVRQVGAGRSAAAATLDVAQPEAFVVFGARTGHLAVGCCWKEGREEENGECYN